jgi:hypothetical protein
MVQFSLVADEVAVESPFHVACPARDAFDAAGRGVKWAVNAYAPGSQAFQMRLTAW